MREYILGIDIGGTKCAVNYAYKEGLELYLTDKEKFPTTSVNETIGNILISVNNMMEKHSLTKESVSAIGISCGGPLDSTKGLIMSPPNLPGWDNIPIVDIIEEKFGIKTNLQNDANACALAEWKYGAGRGMRNMIFMTFGTGLGAGLILDGKLYTGTNDNAGELGHIRLSEYGPVGYGKAGSFEGFCSGGGITQIAKSLILEKIQMGLPVDWCRLEEMELLTAQKVAEEAAKGDELALQIFDITSKELGKGLSIIIDILNPEAIVIGGIFTRCRTLMETRMLEMIKKETLPGSRRVCKIMISQLGEQIGDYAAISVAANVLNKEATYERLDL
ncbi:MAG: ROK family protein [Tannerella sp.]|jgi:glucokinase|nr:ROK family protein [Tannerella sp.]